jgi:hypothetical protein
MGSIAEGRELGVVEVKGKGRGGEGEGEGRGGEGGGEGMVVEEGEVRGEM